MKKVFKIDIGGELPFNADNLALIQRIEDAMGERINYMYSDQADCMERFLYKDSQKISIDVRDVYDTPKEGDMVFDNFTECIAYRDQWDLDNPYKAPKKVEAA